MPVQRFRRVDDVPPPEPRDPGDPAAMDHVWSLLRSATADLPPAFAPGVRRYASIEAAGADRRAAEVARMRRLRERAIVADRSSGSIRALDRRDPDPHG